MVRAACLLALVLLAAGCGGGATVVVGAGSTLVAPLVAKWAATYEPASITYSGIGSGGGIAQTAERTVDLGASDAPLPAGSRATLVQIPWALGATVVAVNLPGPRTHPKLTGAQLADIYLGRRRYWDDVAPGLPHLRIASLYRSDSSGDTFVLTSYLARVTPAWRSTVGAGVDVRWPTGSGAKGNAGMTAALRQTKGAIAYIGIAQAKAASLDYVLLRNRAGRYPEPSPATIAQAAASARGGTIVDAPLGYPLSTYSYALVDRTSKKLAALKPFLRYAVGAGQAFATGLSFAPLPARVRTADLKLIDGL